MSRPTRIEFEGAWYHVMNRGAGRCVIFKTDGQRENCIKLLGLNTHNYKAATYNGIRRIKATRVSLQ